MKRLLQIFVFTLVVNSLWGQFTIPYTFINNSEYSDTEIYIGLVGKFGDNIDVWMDMSDYSLIPMSSSQNVLDGPIWSTPASWKYPDIFTKLSDIDANSIVIPQGLYGCRIFISFESPMYLHFHETGGYAGANLNASTDPNDGIRWEIVELTWGNSGLWTNTSRVDAYQYPIAVELSGFTGGLNEPSYVESYASAIAGNGSPKYGIVGEKIAHQEILARWNNDVSDDYLVAKIIKEHSIDGGYIIEQPSKVEDFKEDILDDYIDDIWQTYRDNDLVIDIGERGIWLGTVTGDSFNFVDPVDGSIATIYGKPSSFNAIEGSGFLAFTDVPSSINREKHDEDLMIQAQIAAAINRHAIYTDVTDGTVQNTHDADRYFIHEPYNEYVSFFHNEEISHDSKTYAFAYDDVGDHSSTLQNTFPTGARVIIGGYDQYITPDPEITILTISPYVKEIEQGQQLQFIAQAYDQYSEAISSDVLWTVTGSGSTIDDNGLFNATNLGEHIITAKDGTLERSTSIIVTEIPDFTSCEAVSPNGDYSYIATDEPTLTFIPSVVGNGDPVCLLYYKTDRESNFIDAGVNPNEAYSLNAMDGDTIFFYYTYSLASGGENNTSGTLQNFVVGECDFVSSNQESESKLKNLELFPNPTEVSYTHITGIDKDVIIKLYKVSGELVSSKKVSNRSSYKIDLTDLNTGLYLVSVSTLDAKDTRTFKLVID